MRETHAIWLPFLLLAFVLEAHAVRAGEPSGGNNRVLVLLAEGFNGGEFWGPYPALRAAGYRVDIAAAEKGTVFLSGEKKPTPEKDPQANLTLDEVQPADYVGLFLPGGFSPGNLEKFPRALEICTAFMAAGKPIAAICHGPRLLMRAKLLSGRTVTCLNTVADELADAWAAREYGKYLDLPVVVDGNLVTSRYPGDVTANTQAFLEKLANSGGLPRPKLAANVVVVAPGTTPHHKWLFSNLEALGLKVKVLGEGDVAAYLKGREPNAPPLDVLVVLEGPGLEGLKAVPEFAALLKDLASRKALVLATAAARAALGEALPADAALLQGADLWEQMRQLLIAAQTATKDRATPGPIVPDYSAAVKEQLSATAPAPAAWEKDATYDAALALRPGFDDYVYAKVAVWLGEHGLKAIVLGPQKGDLRGLNGLTVPITATYAEPPKLAPHAVIIAPGGVWPKKAQARQATQPQWVADQEAARQERLDWLAARYKDGAALALFGFDSLALGSGRPEFKGQRFASSDQAVWSFGKEGAGYAGDAPALLTAERLLTAKGAVALPEALKLLEAQLPWRK